MTSFFNTKKRVNQSASPKGRCFGGEPNGLKNPNGTDFIAKNAKRLAGLKSVAKLAHARTLLVRCLLRACARASWCEFAKPFAKRSQTGRLSEKLGKKPKPRARIFTSSAVIGRKGSRKRCGCCSSPGSNTAPAPNSNSYCVQSLYRNKGGCCHKRKGHRTGCLCCYLGVSVLLLKTWPRRLKD